MEDEDFDSILARRWQSGDERDQVFREIYSRHHRQVFNFFSRRGFSEAESEDLTQESFRRVLNSLADFRFESPFGSWLFGIAADVYKSEIRRRRAFERDSPEASARALTAAPEEEIRRQLKAALEKMPTRMRQWVMLAIKKA